MHELSLAESLLQIVESTTLRERLYEVQEIVVEIGELSAVEPEALEFCFGSVAKGTAAEGAKLSLIAKAGEGWCDHCMQTVPMSEKYMLCPQCGGAQIRITGGDRMRILEIVGK